MTITCRASAGTRSVCWPFRTTFACLSLKRDIVRAAKRLGIRVTEGCGTSHWKFERDGGTRPFPISAHNGEKQQISDLYIRKMCKAMGIDEAELKALF